MQQLPLTVSPFVSLPTATPLPYSYKQLPATLPPSVTDPPQDAQGNSSQAAYVIAQSTGHSAHPDQIIASCQALQAHLQKLQEDSVKTIQKWQDDIKQRELMERRRVAPGWLDVEQKMLVPERKEAAEEAKKEAQANQGLMDVDVPKADDGGEELDRAFGGMGLR